MQTEPPVSVEVITPKGTLWKQVPPRALRVRARAHTHTQMLAAGTCSRAHPGARLFSDSCGRAGPLTTLGAVGSHQHNVTSWSDRGVAQETLFDVSVPRLLPLAAQDRTGCEIPAQSPVAEPGQCSPPAFWKPRVVRFPQDSAEAQAPPATPPLSPVLPGTQLPLSSKDTVRLCSSHRPQ